MNLVGSEDVTRLMVQKGGTILVKATMRSSNKTASGYEWTSKGYDKPITAGTTTQCKITVEERAPITYIIPLLRKWLMGMNDQELTIPNN